MSTKNSYSIRVSDSDIVDGVYRQNGRMGYALYERCRDYYDENFRGVFIVQEADQEDIFQNTMVTLLEKIESRQIYVQDGVLYGKNGKPFTSSLTTFFMGIAKLKYKEWVRKHPSVVGLDTNGKKKVANDDDLYRDILYDDDENSMISIIADCISRMSKRCSEILTLFYYEEKSLDEILLIVPTYKSKDALKSEKYKCMKTLKETANEIYRRFYQ